MYMRSFFPKRRVRTKGTVITITLIILLMAVNLTFIWFNSAKTASDSNNTSKSITKSVAPYVIDGYKNLSKSERNKKIYELNSKIRTMAHTVEYIPLGFLLVLLVVSVFDVSAIKRNNVVSLALLSSALALLFALIDEVHQIFVDGRAFEIKDIALDMLGMFLGCTAFLLCCVIYRINKLRKEL